MRMATAMAACVAACLWCGRADSAIELTDADMATVRGNGDVPLECQRIVGLCPPSCNHTQWECTLVTGSETICHRGMWSYYVKCIEMTSEVRCFDTQTVVQCWALFKNSVVGDSGHCNCSQLVDTGCPDNVCDQDPPAT